MIYYVTKESSVKEVFSNLDGQMDSNVAIMKTLI